MIRKNGTKMAVLLMLVVAGRVRESELTKSAISPLVVLHRYRLQHGLLRRSRALLAADAVLLASDPGLSGATVNSLLVRSLWFKILTASLAKTTSLDVK